MKLTNKAGLHPLAHRAVVAQARAHPSMKQEPRFASVTELNSPACQVALKRRYWDQLEEESEKRIWALFGSALHKVLEPGRAGERGLRERRLALKVGEHVITVGLDSYEVEEKWLADFKLTSVWSIVFGDRVKEWEAQTNIYAEMLRCAGFPVEKITVEVFLKDWSRRELETDRKAAIQYKRPCTYPDKDWKSIPLRIWPTDEVLEFVKERIYKLESALGAGIPAECSKDERWEKETTWAVFKGKNKRATKVFKEESKKETRADAEVWIAKQKKPDDYHIEDRSGKRVRCEQYCIAAQVCPHWKAHLEDLYGRDFGPDKDEQTRPPEMERSATGEQAPPAKQPKDPTLRDDAENVAPATAAAQKDLWGATPVTAGVKRSRKGSA